MKSTWLRRILLVAVVIVVLAAILPALRYYRYFSTHVSTDDAYVDGSVGLVSSRIAGTVVKVFVEDNWRVKAGDTLVELDPSDFQVQVNGAQAQLERARQTVDQLYAQLEAARSGERLAASQLRQARIDYNRARQLKAQGVVSSEYFDQATTALRVALATEGLARHQMMQAEAALGASGADHERYDRPVVQQAEAALEAARLNLSYTTIKAPFDGIVTRKSVHVGHRIEPGQPLMALVPVRGLYITANYKETQLTAVRVGQPAEVEADIYPGYIYRAHVDSISIGTGSAFALLPPENATGNWVKVVQRIPVKIVLDQAEPADKPLRMGLSVEVTIDISDTRGPLLTSTLQHVYGEHGAIPESLRREHPLEESPQQYHLIPPAEPGTAAPGANPATPDAAGAAGGVAPSAQTGAAPR
ncbi:MAG TPA: HlyD family secretion protein [Candidatus Binataceae bacterium]|nr:HlyD family secretion protein [Candidatus Binataceae bacterium]